MKRFRTEEEREVGKEVEKIFTKNPDTIEIKLENFPKYVRRQHLKRFLTLYEIYKKLIPVKGSIIELGVFRAVRSFSFAFVFVFGLRLFSFRFRFVYLLFRFHFITFINTIIMPEKNINRSFT